MSDLLSLAERVEGLSGPCREVDVLVARAIGLFDGMRSSYELNRNLIPAYTASIDAALTLVPNWLAPTIIGHDRQVRLYNGLGLPVQGSDYCSTAATIPLAITAAALKARAAQEQQPS